MELRRHDTSYSGVWQTQFTVKSCLAVLLPGAFSLSRSILFKRVRQSVQNTELRITCLCLIRFYLYLKICQYESSGLIVYSMLKSFTRGNKYFNNYDSLTSKLSACLLKYTNTILIHLKMHF